MATATVEYHPENAPASHIVVVHGERDGQQVGPIWFGYETAERAKAKRPEYERKWTEAGF
jgi:hypothetical protein